MTAPFEGGCHCGSVRYKANVEPLNCFFCHCTDCQKISGSGFTTLVIVPQDSVEISGPIAAYEGKSQDGSPKVNHFCEKCGVSVIGAPSRAEGLYCILGGTLDDPSWLQPRGHIFVKSQQPWVKIDDGLPRFEEYMIFPKKDD